MDFKRIEWIFFVAFFGLNLFLFGIYREGMQDESSVSYSGQTEKIENRLKKDGISYKGNLSETRLEGYYLSGEQTNFKEALQNGELAAIKPYANVGEYTITSTPSKNYFINEKNIHDTLKTFLGEKKSLLYGDEYQFLNEFSNFTGEFPEIIAVQSYKGIPFRDDTAQLSISLEKSGDLLKVNKYTQTHIGSIDELRDKMDLYSSREAVETLYVNNRIPSNSTINFIKLAYSRIYKIREKSVYVPVWFIGITNNGNLQIEHVNALSNTIITNNTVPKVENH
ncbi:two-component system regulatory protein YycI [Enterococcus rivorum]|uniref:Regulatory protein YycH-like domain-containing protein n=1 Tax=Enterococcus rivorum TaxID=762845 RepID=A0A1E5KVU2_9ENTE|nr:two-component system regulatory protein YycI [Enterococcus rivorum]MBP2099001.1 regulatory protein YycI of two-component signal transduction system YycFG [Enterococcus rivorum]OEH81983.1 hypothetical protein BCR26_15170 [Enterococcus rivorum]